MKVLVFLEPTESVQGFPAFVQCVRETWDKTNTPMIYLVASSGRAWQTAYALGVEGIVESPGPYTFDRLLKMITESGKTQ